jgi:hypothetical protein
LTFLQNVEFFTKLRLFAELLPAPGRFFSSACFVWEKFAAYSLGNSSKAAPLLRFKAVRRSCSHNYPQEM